MNQKYDQSITIHLQKVFSIVGLMVQDKLSMLAPENFNKIVFVHNNTQLLIRHNYLRQN